MNVFDYFFAETKREKKNFLLNESEAISFQQLHHNSLALAQYIHQEIGENNKVILLSHNSLFFVTCYLAIIKSGNVCVPLNPQIEQSNFAYIEDLIECKLSFVANSVKSHYTFNSDTISESELESIINKVKDTDRWISERELQPFDENRLAEILFTSGSTGVSKGVMLSHLNLKANTQSILGYLNLSSSDSMLLVLPFYYCYGLSVLHTHLKVGASIAFNNNFILLGSIIDDLIKYKSTGFAGVPSHFQLLLRKSKAFKESSFPNFRYATQAGGKLHEVFIKEFIDAFPSVSLYVMYGQTEATARLAYLQPTKLKEKLGSIGKAIPGVTLKVVDNNGKEVPAGQVGEIVAKGDNIMKGYLNDVAETSKVLREGWLHTGDLGKKDEEGYIYLVSRKKEIMKIGGHRISPKEIEEVIVSINKVVDCTVTAIDDNLLGEAIKAVIVVDNNNFVQRELRQEILNVCKHKLSPIKTPHVIEFVTKMDVSSSGKKVKPQTVSRS